MDRREFLQRGVITGSALLASESVWVSSLAAASAGARNLVFVELDGGNDGLNTLVPYGLEDGLYSTLYRSKLAVPSESLHLIDERVGFHPSLAALLPTWNAGQLAVIQGVGSPQPTFSHDFAKKVWSTGEPSGEAATGWLGRHLASLPSTQARGFDVAPFANRLFLGAKQAIPAFPGLGGLKFPIDKKHKDDGGAREAAFRSIMDGLGLEDSPRGTIAAIAAQGLAVAEDYRDIPSIAHSPAYPKHAFGDALKLVARVLASDLGVRYHHVAFPGFDTHARQNDGFSHAQKLAVLAQALAGFRNDLVHTTTWKKTLIVVYSEFGRALFENASEGTDHGTAAPVFVLGDAVNGGLYGEHPSLAPENLSAIQEMVATVDYRDVLGTVALRWLEADVATLFPGHVPADIGFVV